MNATLRNRERTLPLDLYAYRAKETDYWNIPDKYAPYIEEIFCVYMFDRNTHVNCCEITASFEMQEAYYGVYCNADTPESISDEIWDWVTTNADRSEPWSYRHVSGIEKMIESDNERIAHIGNPDTIGLRSHGEDFDYQWECALEDTNANPPY